MKPHFTLWDGTEVWFSDFNMRDMEAAMREPIGDIRHFSESYASGLGISEAREVDRALLRARPEYASSFQWGAFPQYLLDACKFSLEQATRPQVMHLHQRRKSLTWPTRRLPILMAAVDYPAEYVQEHLHGGSWMRSEIFNIELRKTGVDAEWGIVKGMTFVKSHTYVRHELDCYRQYPTPGSKKRVVPGRPKSKR
jgi:hypothetical protein